MDTIEKISISKIAAIITDPYLLSVNNSLWEKILSVAGQSGLFMRLKNSLTPYSYNISNGRTYENPNPQFAQYFSAVNEILKSVYNSGQGLDEFTILMKEIINELNVSNVFPDEVVRSINRGYFGDFEEKLPKKLSKMSIEEVEDFILKNAKEEFNELRRNLQILNLDVMYESGRLRLQISTNQGAKELERNISSLLKWLEDTYLGIAEIYIEAIENYIAGNTISCISNCRNIILGICEGSKEDETKWLKGLQNLSTDTYIDKVQVPSQIVNGTANRVLGISNVEFKFSRFQTVYQIYSLASDLGPHISEGPMIAGKVYTENSTLADALWILRMTEDFLVWVKNNQKGIIF